jgi:WD40 repeat protein
MSVNPPLEAVTISVSAQQPSEAIRADNLQYLTNTAVFGKGAIRSVVFAPDGRSFAVGSAVGVAIYDRQTLDQAPRWLPFPNPVGYEHLFYSRGGRALLLSGKTFAQAFDLTSGVFIEDSSTQEWIRPASTINGDPELKVQSADSSLTLISTWVDHPPSKSPMPFSDIFTYTEKISKREVFGGDPSTPLYVLDDELPVVTYEDRNEPIACDVTALAISHCLNPFEAIAVAPYRAAFSPSGKSLTILYRPPDIGSTQHFNTLRSYRTDNGNLIGSPIGSRTQPVTDFAYAPDAEQILMGFTDGTVELWDVGAKEPRFHTTDFTPTLESFSLTPDGNYLVLQYDGRLEIRLARDGSVLSRFNASGYAISPVGALVAIADQEGNIDIFDIPSGKASRISAHKDGVLAMAFSPDGKTLATSGGDCAIRAWDVTRRTLDHLFDHVIVSPYPQEGWSSRILVDALTYLPGTNQLLGFGSFDTLASWDATSGAAQFNLLSQGSGSYYPGADPLAPDFLSWFDPDLVNHQFSMEGNSYDLATGQSLGPIPTPESPVGYVSDCKSNGPLSLDGQLVFTQGFDNHQGEVCVLDSSSQRLEASIKVPQDGNAGDVYLGQPVISPDGVNLYFPIKDGAVYVYQIGR